MSTRDHTVPRLYLARFADPKRKAKNPQVWVTDGETGRRRPSSIGNESVVRGFYGAFERVLADAVDTDQLGKLLDRVEGGEAFTMPRKDLEISCSAPTSLQ